MRSFFTFPSKWIRKSFSLSQTNIIFYFHYVLRAREKERQRYNFSYFSRKRIFHVCTFYISTLHLEKKKIIKEKTSSQVNHMKTILTFRDIKSMYFYGSEDFSKVNKVSSATFSMLFALILWNFEIPLFPQISSGFVSRICNVSSV